MKFQLYELKRIVKSTDGNERYKYDDNGGYTIHPVSEFGKLFNNNKNKDGRCNQNLILFIIWSFSQLLAFLYYTFVSSQFEKTFKRPHLNPV